MRVNTAVKGTVYAHSRNIRNLCLKIRKLHVNGRRIRPRLRHAHVLPCKTPDLASHGGAMKIVAECEIRESEGEVVEEEKQSWH